MAARGHRAETAGSAQTAPVHRAAVTSSVGAALPLQAAVCLQEIRAGPGCRGSLLKMLRAEGSHSSLLPLLLQREREGSHKDFSFVPPSHTWLYSTFTVKHYTK